MAVAVNTSGSQTATLTTEHTLATVTTAEALQLAVDMDNLAAGERLTLRIYGKARSADTERLLFSADFDGSNLNYPLAMSPVFLSPHHFKATLEQNGGTGRAFPWAIYESGA